MARLHGPRSRRARHHQPARDHRRLEPRRPAGRRQRDRLAGHPHRRIAAALDRDGRGEVIRARTGLPPATYFSGGKLRWILDNVDGVRADAASGDAIFGTIDCWLIWNLTGGVGRRPARHRRHQRQPHDADGSATRSTGTTSCWRFFDIPRACCRRSCRHRDPGGYGATRAEDRSAARLPIGGVLGDQQAAMVGQACFAAGEAKNTYGTGNFLLLNTGTQLVPSQTRAADDGLLPVRRRQARCMRWKARSP